MGKTLAFARRIADGAPLSVQAIKRLVRAGASQDLTTALEMVASEMTVVRSSEDHKEALAAFKEKRKPTFTGR
jgi:2-(1,2-epoxy-1,2-dihydrophenyl)acetyl-CoA isomerase